MKLFVLLSVLFGLTSSSPVFAQPSPITCSGGPTSFLKATLVHTQQYGWIATVVDGYDSTKGIKPGTSEPRWNWMPCKTSGRSIHCRGFWMFEQVPVTAIFNRNDQGHLEVIFTRDALHGFGKVKLPCKAGAVQ